MFGAAKQAGVNSRINLTDKSRVCVQKGPMNIDGVTSKWGLLTFEPNIKKYHPQEGAMLMLEVYAKEQAVLTVKLIADYFGDKVEYMSSVIVKENETLDSALRRFKRSCAKAGIQQEIRKREHYEKPSVKRKKKSEAARKRKYN